MCLKIKLKQSGDVSSNARDCKLIKLKRCKCCRRSSREFFSAFQALVGGAVASWLVRSSPERAVRVRDLAEDAVLCSWARHLTLSVPLSTQEYKWVPANC